MSLVSHTRTLQLIRTVADLAPHRQEETLALAGRDLAPHDSSGVVDRVLCGREDAKKTCDIVIGDSHNSRPVWAERGMLYRLCRTRQEGNLDPAIVFP